MSKENKLKLLVILDSYVIIYFLLAPIIFFLTLIGEQHMLVDFYFNIFIFNALLLVVLLLFTVYTRNREYDEKIKKHLQRLFILLLIVTILLLIIILVLFLVYLTSEK